MPRDPSPNQIEASRANLKGHYGPKTIEGKRIAANNGRKNRGVKSAKARAMIIHARWGPSTETFYSYAGCSECNKRCLWPSFSVKTPHRQLPLACMDDILRENPQRCFYYFERFCCASTGRNTSDARAPCILDPGFLRSFQKSPSNSLEDLEKLELDKRRRNAALKREMALYLKRMHHWGYHEIDFTPRMKHVIRYFQRYLLISERCKLEAWRSRDDDDVLEWLAQLSV